MWKKFLPALIAVVLLSGCTGTFTNLSATKQPRNPANLYPVGVAFHSRQQTLRWDSIKPYILVGKESYPMTKTPLAENRWEGLIPVPADVNGVEYRFKFDFEYNAFGPPKTDSAMSPAFKLQVRGQ